MNHAVKFAVVAFILALGMIISSALLPRIFLRIKHEQAIEVKGYAEKNITSDIGKFSCTCSARGTSLSESYDILQKSKLAILDYLRKAGFTSPEIAIGTIDTTKVHRRDANGNATNEIDYYDAWQSFTVTSNNVELVSSISTAITDLIKEGIDISASSPQFFISDLQNIKLDLLAQATEDGYKRALTLAGRGAGKVGALVSARQGVFQITERNSTDISGYGEYDTSTIDKTAKAVVTLEYAIEKR